MIKEHYEVMKARFGKTASWAIWDNQIGKDSSGDYWIHDEFLFRKLSTRYIFISLNPSNNQNINEARGNNWGKFHGGNFDYRLRDALKNTKFWGAYLTDIKSDVIETDSNKVDGTLNTYNIEKLKEEISLLGNPIPIALGDATWKILNAYKNFFGFSKVYKICHYSYRYIDDIEWHKRALTELSMIP